MGRWGRRRSAPGRRASVDPGPVPGVPVEFDAVAEALVSGRDLEAPVEVVARRLAGLGVPLSEVLDGLWITVTAATGREPSYVDTARAAVAWSETTLSYVATVSCEDPLTGLASRAHLRARLGELYRVGGDVGTRHALVVIEMPTGVGVGRAPGVDLARGETLDRSLLMAEIARSARVVFDAEPIGRVGTGRLAVVVDREPPLARRLELVERLLRAAMADVAPASPPARLWIESLPAVEAGVEMLLDELSRN